MRAWQITDLAEPARLCDLPEPQPAPGEALVRIAACGLNFADLLMARGKYQDRPPLPFIPGLEFAGTVVALGPGTDGPAPGTRVACYAGKGGLAELAAVPAARLVPIPDTMPFDQAAGFLVAYGTSHLALTWKAHLQPGETLFVTGAAGGVGLTAVEVGKHLGARVIASVRGPDKAAIARAAGADLVIDSDAPDLKETLRAAGGVDVVYDTVGGPAFDQALRATRPDGRILAIGFASGDVPQVPANILLVKNLTVMGFWWGGYLAFAPAVLTDSLGALMAWYGAGKLNPHVSHSLPFDQLPQGLDLLRNRTATGKVVIRVDAG